MAVGGGAISSDDVVIKSPTDRRLHRYIQIANGLCALLVHDPEIYSDQPYGERKLGDSEEDEDKDMDKDKDEDEDEDEEEDDEDFGEGDSGEEDDVEEEEEKGFKGSLQKKAAAAMCVGMGSFKDPYEAQSLTHFLDVQHEPWFRSRFVEEDIPSSLMELWKDPPEINSSLHLPSMNDFIPHDFSIRADKASCHVTDALSPMCILDEPQMKLWYMLDSTFRLPRANTHFRISLKGGYSNLRNAVLTELYILLLKDELSEIIYQASVAKLDSSVSLDGDKLELKLYGFNDKLSVLLNKVLGIAKSFLPNDDRFKVVKEDMERTLRNTNLKPLNHSSYQGCKFCAKVSGMWKKSCAC